MKRRRVVPRPLCTIRRVSIPASGAIGSTVGRPPTPSAWRNRTEYSGSKRWSTRSNSTGYSGLEKAQRPIPRTSGNLSRTLWTRRVKSCGRQVSSRDRPSSTTRPASPSCLSRRPGRPPVLRSFGGPAFEGQYRDVIDKTDVTGPLSSTLHQPLNATLESQGPSSFKGLHKSFRTEEFIL